MAAIRGRGSKILVKVTSGDYVEIKGLGDIEANDPETQFLDTTNQDTPVGATEQMAVESSAGSLSAPINFDIQEQSHRFMMTARKNQTLLDFRLKIAGPGNMRQTFQGYVRGLPKTFPVGGVQRATLNIVVHGDYSEPELDV